MMLIVTIIKCRHSTDREIAIMTLMAYLSYILAEVRSVSVCFCCFGMRWEQFEHLNVSHEKFFCTIFLSTLALPHLEWFALISSFPLYAALLFEWDSHCLLLWHCHVSLHMAQYLRKLTCHHQVCISTQFSARNLLLLTFMNSSLLYIIAAISWVSSFQVKQLEEWAYSSSFEQLRNFWKVVNCHDLKFYHETYRLVLGCGVAGMDLQLCRLLQRPSSFYMWVWMHWM